MANCVNMEPKEIYIPLADWDQHFKWPSVNGMRKRFEFRERNGYKTAFIKEGVRVIVKVNEFWKCLEAKGEK